MSLLLLSSEDATTTPATPATPATTGYNPGVLTGNSNGTIYTIKRNGIYAFGQDISQVKAFAIATPEVLLADDVEYRNLIIDIDAGDDPVTVQYIINGEVLYNYAITTNGRQRIYKQVPQNKGARVKVRIFRDTISTYVNTAIYGIFLQ